jgi:lipoprotein NlpI
MRQRYPRLAESILLDLPRAETPLDTVQALVARGAWEEARQAAQDWQAQDPQNPQASALLAFLLLPDPAALPLLQIAAAQNHPWQAVSAKLLSLVQVPHFTALDVALRLVEAEQWPYAERLLTLYLEENTLDALAFAYRGYTLDQQGRNGLADLQTAQALQPDLALPYYFLGLHYRQRKIYDLSLQAFLDAHLLDPQNPALAAEVAFAHQNNDNFVLAAEWYTLAVALAPQDERFAAAQAAFYADTGYQPREAFTLISPLAATYADNPSLRASWGRILALNGQQNEARRVLEAALALQPDAPRTHYFLALTLEALDEDSLALTHFVRAASVDSSFQAAARLGIQRLGG